jgi:hypothetical protein
MGEFTVTLSEDDLYRGFQLHAANGRLRPLAMSILICVGLFGTMLAISPTPLGALLHDPAIMMMVGALLLAAFLAALALGARHTVWRSIARRTLEQRRELATPVEWAFDDQGVRSVTRFSRSAYPWDAFIGWRDNDQTLLIYLADTLFYTIPKAQAGEAHMTALLSALEAHGVPHR